MWNPFSMNKENTEENEKNVESSAEADTTHAEVASEEPKEADSVATEGEKKEEVLTPEDIKDLQEKASKAEEYWNKLLHLVADFDNFKKRSERKRQDDILSAKVAIVETFLPVLDNFEMAFMASAQVTDPAAKSLQQGIEMVLSQFHNVLRDCGVETIEPQGEEFDHSYHEAVSEVETDEVEDGHVAQVLRKGYKMGTRLIRAARVVVGRKVKEKAE